MVNDDDAEKIKALQDAARAVVETDTAKNDESLRRVAIAACKAASRATGDK